MQVIEFSKCAFSQKALSCSKVIHESWLQAVLWDDYTGCFVEANIIKDKKFKFLLNSLLLNSAIFQPNFVDQLQQLASQPNAQTRIDAEQKLQKQKQDLDRQLSQKAQQLLQMRLVSLRIKFKSAFDGQQCFILLWVNEMLSQMTSWIDVVVKPQLVIFLCEQISVLKKWYFAIVYL